MIRSHLREWDDGFSSLVLISADAFGLPYPVTSRVIRASEHGICGRLFCNHTVACDKDLAESMRGLSASLQAPK